MTTVSDKSGFANLFKILLIFFVFVFCFFPFSNAEDLTLLSTYDTPGDGHDAYVADGTAGIQILRRSTSTTEDLPDLTVKSLKNAKNIKKGKKTKIKATVKNTGTASSNKTKISFYLSKNKEQSLMGNQVFIEAKRVKVLSAGKGTTVSFNWKVPKKQRKRNYYIKAFCDSITSVDESDETNNIKVSKKIKVK